MATEADPVDERQHQRQLMWRVAEALYYYNNEVSGDWATEDPVKRSYYLKMATTILAAINRQKGEDHVSVS